MQKWMSFLWHGVLKNNFRFGEKINIEHKLASYREGKKTTPKIVLGIKKYYPGEKIDSLFKIAKTKKEEFLDIWNWSHVISKQV